MNPAVQRFDFDVPQQNVLDLRRAVVTPPPTPEKRRSLPRRRLRLPSWHFRLDVLHRALTLPRWTRRRSSTNVGSKLQPAFRSGSAFLTACVITLLPIFGLAVGRTVLQAKGQVLAAASQAVQQLNVAKAQAAVMDFPAAGDAFSAAEQQFDSAASALDEVNGAVRFLLRLVPGSAFASGENLVAAGQRLSEAGRLATELFGPATDPVSYGEVAPGRPAVTLQLDVPKLRDGSAEVRRLLVEANDSLRHVNVNRVPAPQRDSIRAAQAQLPALLEHFSTVDQLLDFGTRLFGYGGEREYLLLFQNNAELRPAGGFLGSLALVAMEDGALRVIEVPGRGPYELDTPSTAPIIPPKPLQYINTEWQIQDANWWPDFPTSAEKVMWFYEQSRGFAVDGVLALTPDVLEELLALTGPIAMPDYSVTVTADNFVDLAQREVELNYDLAANRPKQFIADLLPLVLQRALSLEPAKLPELLRVLERQVKAKQFLLSLRDPQAQEELNAFDWSGRIKEAPFDYLSVVSATIAGDKTDRVIQDATTAYVDVQADGSMISTVELTRHHDGVAGATFTGTRNLSYVRFYVPKGSELLAVQGFSRVDSTLERPLADGAQADPDLQRIQGTVTTSEANGTTISQEFGKSAFGVWLEVQPGETKTLTVRYKLPYRWNSDEQTYQLLVQKQPGAKTMPFKLVLTPPPGTSLVWSSGDIRRDGEAIIYSTSIDQDRDFAAILNQEE